MAWKHPSTLTSSTDLEEGCDIALDFERFLSASGQGVLPVVAQDVESRDVLVLAHAKKPPWTTPCARAWRRSGACRETACGSRERHPATCWTSSRCA